MGLTLINFDLRYGKVASLTNHHLSFYEVTNVTLTDLPSLVRMNLEWRVLP